ncbi:MAG: hypothetical protein R3F61_34160 [Myxococcota bacterium]
MDLVGTLSAHRAHLVDAFRGPSWAAVAQDYGATGATREDQLRAALTAVVTWARGLTADPAVLAHLDTFVSEAMDAAVPKTGAVAGLSMIFANATASTGWWASQMSSKTTYVASCTSCGAPQKKLLKFTCEYCGLPLYEELR